MDEGRKENKWKKGGERLKIIKKIRRGWKKKKKEEDEWLKEMGGR